MIYPITDFPIEVCWSECRKNKNCTWFSYSPSEALCFLMKDCREKNNVTGWISSNRDCNSPISKKVKLLQVKVGLW